MNPEKPVRAVFDTICPEKDRPYFTQGEMRAWLKDSRDAAVAVLRVLAREDCDWRPEELEALAGEIEEWSRV